jgi:GT2 family glycosyltransferase
MPNSIILKDLISISIVYYNSENYVKTVLPSVLTTIRSTGIQCFLIDNGSTDNSRSRIQGYLEPKDHNINFIKSPTNLGYGKAHNLVLDQLTTPFHLICNPDIILEDPTVLERTLAFLLDNPAVGLATVRLLNRDGSLQPANKRYPTVLDLFCRRFCGRGRPAWARRRMERYEMLDVGYDRVVDVPFVTGAFMFVRTSCFKAVSGFDPRYFLYFEDADLSREIQKTHRTVYFPDTSVVHFWDRASHKKLMIMLIFITNGFRYFNKWGWKIA